MQKIEDSLKPFQKRVRDFILTRPASAVWMTMGSGKTLVTLSALSYLREPGHILVVAPRNIAVDTWPEELFDWNIPLRVTSLNITPPGIRGKNGRPNKGSATSSPRSSKRSWTTSEPTPPVSTLSARTASPSWSDASSMRASLGYAR